MRKPKEVNKNARASRPRPFIGAVPFALASTVILSVLLSVSACSAASGPVTQTKQLPFALTTLTLYDHAKDATFAACFERIESILHKFNMYSADSEISKVNQAAGTGAVPVSEDLCEALRQAQQLASLTDGLFDPTVGPLVKLWKIGSDQAHVPKPEEIRSTLRLIGWKDVVLDENARTVSLLRPGMTLDFGAILKGLAAVEAGRVLYGRGVKSAVVDVGGSVLALGSRPDGTPWRIGIQTPGAQTGVYLGVVDVRDEVVNTSGSYEQFFIQNGRRYQHIFNPHTGYPVDNGVESVTVVANRLHNADGPTLAILALGVEKGLAFARQLGVDAVIIGEDRKIHMTAGVGHRFTLYDSSYGIADH
jgi:thiamine biosynthesis lipoprotein